MASVKASIVVNLEKFRNYDKVGVDDDIPRCTSQRRQTEVWYRTRRQAEAAAAGLIQRQQRQRRRRSRFQEMKPSDFGERKVILFLEDDKEQRSLSVEFITLWKRIVFFVR